MSSLFGISASTTQLLNTIKALRQLKDRTDPAIGLTIRIRRGPLSQETRDDWDEREESFPTTTLETNATEIVDALIRDKEESLRLIYIPSLKQEITACQEALAAAEAILNPPPQKGKK